MQSKYQVRDTTTSVTYDVVATDLDIVFYERDFRKSWFDQTSGYTKMLYQAYSAGKRAGLWSDKTIIGMRSDKSTTTDEFYVWLETHELFFDDATEAEEVPLDEPATDSPSPS